MAGSNSKPPQVPKKGGGTQETRMYTLKAVQPVGDGTLTGYYDYSDRAEIDYQDMTIDMLRRLVSEGRDGIARALRARERDADANL